MPKIRLNENAIKIIACISMFIDHFAAAFSIGNFPELLLRWVIGRLAFPLFCFTLVEGFLHTRNLRKYLLRLILAALISEVPFDLVFFHEPFYTGYQNTLFTLTCGLLLLQLLQLIREHVRTNSPLPRLLLSAVSIGAFAAAAEFLHFDYGYSGILCIAAIYIVRTCFIFPLYMAEVWGCFGLNLPYFTLPCAFLAVIPICFYTGKRGRRDLKWFFYLFYPCHLLLLFLIRTVFI
ncbi:MAG: TraX family protein [Eubacteriales bacterium]|nr:TraX family protein [Eubacteriales bacterium]